MSSPGADQPVKRRPGRPRKIEQQEVPTPREIPEATQSTRFPADDWIGRTAADAAGVVVAFSDGRQYRIADGVIVERVH